MNDNYTGTAFSRYMQQLSESHVDVAHTANENHFFRGELEEFYIGLRNKVNFPAVVQEGWGASIQSINNALWKRRETSFIIVKDYDESGDFDHIETAFETCEIIGDEFVRKIMQESEDALNCIMEIEVSDISRLQNEQERYVGLRYTLLLDSPFSTTVTVSKWEEESSNNSLSDE
ncbi:MAG: hypothetical protein PHR53_00870 [Bacteroidales bacterium]|nr:hypothetical protein [Bacteroidales bacterium]